MEDNKLISLLRFESNEIKAAFEKASIQGRGTPQEVADHREQAFHPYIGRYFPFPHRIAKGNITDSSGNQSASVDCIIISPIHPYTIDSHKKFSIILADGVDVAIEIKPDISNHTELLKALRQSTSVKKLRRVNGPYLLKRERTAEEIEHSKQIPSFVFAIKAKADIADTIKEILEYYRDEQIAKKDQVDYIVILGRGIIVNQKSFATTHVRDAKTGAPKTGLVFLQYDDDTFAAFLIALNRVPHASATFHGSIIEHYLTSIAHSHAQAFQDL